MKLIKRHKSFATFTEFYQHSAMCTGTNMKLSCIIPEDTSRLKNCIVWLSGLTCTEENFVVKAGVQKYLDSTTMIVCPDTSPRDLKLPVEADDYDFGSGASFYVNATEAPYDQNYQMYDYIANEIPALIQQQFNIKKFSIMGHSMGGHGALVIGLRESKKFQTISAFAPIVNPVACGWGKKAFKGYLGTDEKCWHKYDAALLLKQGLKHSNTILISQGSADEFLQEQLLTKNFESAAKQVNQPLIVNYHEGYDHSYYFIATFIESHIAFHLKSFYAQ